MEHLTDNLTDSEEEIGLCNNFHYVIAWCVVDSILITITLAGNILTICAIRLNRKLSMVISNQFIFSQALSDLLVGLSIPYHLAFFLFEILGAEKGTCLLRFVLIAFACSSSIANILAIATDRYIAIVYPLHYNRYMTKKAAALIIFVGWLVALTIAIIPIFWNTWTEDIKCELNNVFPETYINFIVAPLFVTIWCAMFIVYLRIWREAACHAKRLRGSSSYQSGSIASDSKSILVVLLILGCFSVCWLPYFIIIIYIRAYESITHIVYEITFTLAMANSCMNPLIYAWKNANFRKTFCLLIRCKSPNGLNHRSSFITNHVPGSKKNSLFQDGICNGNEDFILRSEIEIDMQRNRNKNKDNDGESSVVTVSSSVASIRRSSV